MRIGYNTWSMAVVPYGEFIPGLHRIGYTALTISVVPAYPIGGQRVPNAAALHMLSTEDRRKIKAECEARDLEISAIVGSQPYVGDDRQEVEAGLARMREAIDLCVEVAPRGQSFVPTMNGTSGGRAGELDRWKDQLVENLGKLCDYAATRGVVVCLEPHVSSAIDSPERAAWLMRAVNHPNCAIDFDISHFEVQTIPMAESIPALLPLTKSVEIKDQNVRRLDAPEPAGWVVPGNARGRCHAPDGADLEYQFLMGGEGDFDLVQYLRLMHEGGWRGAVGFEGSVACQQRPGYDGLAYAESTYRWMRRAWDEADVPLD